MSSGPARVPQDDLAIALAAHDHALPDPAYRSRLRERLMHLEVPVAGEEPADPAPATGQWTGLGPIVAGGLVVVMAIVLARGLPFGAHGEGPGGAAPASHAPGAAETGSENSPGAVPPPGPGSALATPTAEWSAPTARAPEATSTEAPQGAPPPKPRPSLATVAPEAPASEAPPEHPKTKRDRPATQAPPPATFMTIIMVMATTVTM